jgi:hypothetical protein
LHFAMADVANCNGAPTETGWIAAKCGRMLALSLPNESSGWLCRAPRLMNLFGFLKRPAPPPPLTNVRDFFASLGEVAVPAGRGDYQFKKPDGHLRGLVQFIIASDRKLTIHRIWTPYPREGHGGFMLGTLCGLADRHSVEMELKVLPIGRKPYPLSTQQLFEWYKQFGFVGSTKKMSRIPVASGQFAASGLSR